MWRTPIFSSHVVTDRCKRQPTVTCCHFWASYCGRLKSIKSSSRTIRQCTSSCLKVIELFIFGPKSLAKTTANVYTSSTRKRIKTPTLHGYQHEPTRSWLTVFSFLGIEQEDESGWVLKPAMASMTICRLVKITASGGHALSRHSGTINDKLYQRELYPL